MLRQTFGTLAIALLLASCSTALAPTSTTQSAAKAAANAVPANYHVMGVVSAPHGHFDVQLEEGSLGDNDTINSKTYGKYIELKTIIGTPAGHGNPYPGAGYGNVTATPDKPLLFKDVTDLTWSSRQFQGYGGGSPRVSIVVNDGTNNISIFGAVHGSSDWTDFSADSDSESATPTVLFNTSDGTFNGPPFATWDQIHTLYGNDKVVEIDWVADAPQVTPAQIQNGAGVPMIWDLRHLKIWIDKSPCEDLDSDD